MLEKTRQTHEQGMIKLLTGNFRLWLGLTDDLKEKWILAATPHKEQATSLMQTFWNFLKGFDLYAAEKDYPLHTSLVVGNECKKVQATDILEACKWIFKIELIVNDIVIDGGNLLAIVEKPPLEVTATRGFVNPRMGNPISHRIDMTHLTLSRIQSLPEESKKLYVNKALEFGSFVRKNPQPLFIKECWLGNLYKFLNSKT